MTIKKGWKYMKRTISIIITLGILINVFLTVPVFAADVSDGWFNLGDVTKSIVTNEEFDDGFDFVPYGTFANGAWERYCGSEEADDNSVYVSEGKVVINPANGEPAGIRFKYTPQQGDTVFAITARRTNVLSGTYDHSLNSLKVNLYYDNENYYSYESTDNSFLGIDPAVMNEAGTDSTEGYVPNLDNVSIGYYRVTAGSSELGRKVPAGWAWATRTASVNIKDGDEKWDSVEIFSTGAAFEVLSVKIINYSPTGSIYLNEDFGGLNEDNLAESLTEKGFNVPNENGLAVETETGNHYLKMGTNAGGANSSENGAVYKAFPASSSTEMYFTARVKLPDEYNNADPSQAFIVQFDFKDSSGNFRRFYLYNTYWGYGPSGRTFDKPIAVKEQWTTLKFHVRDKEAPLLYLKRDGETEFVSVCANIGTVPETPSLGLVYIGGAVCVDDIRVYEPGIYYAGTNINVNEGKVIGEISVMGETDDQSILSRNFAAILAVYDSNDITKDVEYACVTMEDIIQNNGKLTIEIDDLPDGANKARLYLWDGIDETQMQPQEELLQPFELSI